MPYFRAGLRPTSRFHLSPSETPDSVAEAYSLMAAQTEDWRAWKLGGSNHATRAAFDVEEPYFGALHASEILHQPAEAPLAPLCEIKGEVEIALRIDASGIHHDAWAVALEMPASAIENLPEAGVAALVADRCGAGALLLGPLRTDSLPDPATARLALIVDGETLSEAGLDALTGTPADLLQEFLGLARRHGFSPRPGDWVATGGITACHGFALGSRVQVCLNGVEALDFVVGMRR